MASAVPHPIGSANGEESRAFLQERLAFLGLAYGMIGLTFYTVSNLVASSLPQHSWVNKGTSPVLVANGTYLIQWLICRRGRGPGPAF